MLVASNLAVLGLRLQFSQPLASCSVILKLSLSSNDSNFSTLKKIHSAKQERAGKLAKDFQNTWWWLIFPICRADSSMIISQKLRQKTQIGKLCPLWLESFFILFSLLNSYAKTFLFKSVWPCKECQIHSHHLLCSTTLRTASVFK